MERQVPKNFLHMMEEKEMARYYEKFVAPNGQDMAHIAYDRTDGTGVDYVCCNQSEGRDMHCTEHPDGSLHTVCCSNAGAEGVCGRILGFLTGR